jgi:hypothetical protein
MQVGRQRALRLGITSIAAAALFGGTAWAAGAVPGHGPARPVVAADEESTTSLDEATTTSFEDGSTTTVEETTTTSVDESTTTTVEETTTTTVGETTTTVAEECKPGWGYGDKNHCHSGPPGQNKHGDDGEDGEEHAKKGNSEHGHNHHGDDDSDDEGEHESDD